MVRQDPTQTIVFSPFRRSRRPTSCLGGPRRINVGSALCSQERQMSSLTPLDLEQFGAGIIIRQHDGTRTNAIVLSSHQVRELSRRLNEIVLQNTQEGR